LVRDVAIGTGDVREAASRTLSTNHRLSLVVVGIITTSCCVVTAVVTLAVVIVVIRYRRRHHVMSRDRHEKSATVTPLIAPFLPVAHLPPTTNHHHLRLSAPRLLPDVAKCDSDVDDQHYDVLETVSAYYWPGDGGGGDGGGGGSMPAGGRPAVVGGSCPCSACLLASSSHRSKLCSVVTRQTLSDRC